MVRDYKVDQSASPFKYIPAHDDLPRAAQWPRTGQRVVHVVVVRRDWIDPFLLELEVGPLGQAGEECIDLKTLFVLSELFICLGQDRGLDSE